MRNQSYHGLVPQVWGKRSADTAAILTHVPAVPAGASETSQLPQPAAGSSSPKVSHLEHRSFFDGPFALF